MNITMRVSAISLGLWLVAGCSSDDNGRTDGRVDGPRRDGAVAVDGRRAADSAKPASDAASADSLALSDGAAADGGAQCGRPSDCRLFGDSCDGCTCRALGVRDPDPKCAGMIVACFADPCMGRQADCSPAGRCVVK